VIHDGGVMAALEGCVPHDVAVVCIALLHVFAVRKVGHDKAQPAVEELEAVKCVSQMVCVCV